MRHFLRIWRHLLWGVESWNLSWTCSNQREPCPAKWCATVTVHLEWFQWCNDGAIGLDHVPSKSRGNNSGNFESLFFNVHLVARRSSKMAETRCFKMFSWEMSALEIGYIFRTSLQRFWAIGISCNFSMQSSWGELGRPCLSWWTPPPQNISKEMSMYPCRKLDRNLELGYLPH